MCCYGCESNKNSTKPLSSNSTEKEYHKQMILSKGDSSLFIPKHEINWYFKKENFFVIDSAIIGDNISFFDTVGNIIYQALIVDFENGKPIIKCIDLKKTNYYNTQLLIDSIKDLKKNQKYIIKVYKDN